MDIKTAVTMAKQYIVDNLADEGVTDIGLEEVEYNDSRRTWSITIGFSRPWNRLHNSFAVLAVKRMERSYKILLIREGEHKVSSMKHREFK